jgi:23S rRNA pseudouridine1911/1915/1917 synthase
MMDAPFIEIPIPVMPEHSGKRLDVYLAVRLHKHSRAKVQSLISEGRVFLRGKRAKASAKVFAGERVLIRYPARVDPPSRHARLEVLYEDEVLLAVNKPGDVLSHPTDKTAHNSVTAILAKQFPGGRRHLAHRLDRETSGVLLLAKDPGTAARLQELFAGRRVSKEYWAICAGKAGFKRKRVEIRVRQRVLPKGQGQPAVTLLEVLAASETASWLRARPRTGRLHQIRAHCAWIGLPILGDKLYMGNGEAYLKAWRKELGAEDLEAVGAGRQMLHARRLTIPHPKTNRRLAIEAPAPPDFEACLKAKGLLGLL